MKTNTKYIFILSLITFIFLCYFALYVDKNIKQKIEIVKDYSQKEIQNKNLQAGNKLKTEMDNLANQEKILLETLIDSKDIINFISNIEKIGSELGIDVLIEKVSKGDKEKIGSLYESEKIELNIQITGTLSQIHFFIEKNMNLSKSLNIKELNIYKTSREDNGYYTAKFILEGLTILYE